MSMPAMITGMGALTPVGLSAEASCAALRAGISRLREIESHLVPGPLFDKVPVIGGRVPLEWLDGPPAEEEWPAHERFGVDEPPPPWALVEPGPQRLIELALPAAREAWAAPLRHRTPERLGIYLGLPVDQDAQPIVTAIQADLGVRFTRSVAQPGGRASGLEVLSAAVHDLDSGSVECALVGGTDSQLRGPTLERLEATGSLRTGQNPHGVIPGEASAFVVLEPEAIAGQGGPPAHARVLGAAVATEPSAESGDPNQAIGLSTVLQGIREQVGLDAPPLVICDLNGDRYRASDVEHFKTCVGSVDGQEHRSIRRDVQRMNVRSLPIDERISRRPILRGADEQRRERAYDDCPVHVDTSFMLFGFHNTAFHGKTANIHKIRNARDDFANVPNPNYPAR